MTLTTDFGTSDPYVAQMKGSILTIAPDCQIIDVTHDIPPQDVASAARILREVYRSFPPGSVHLTVVDPGVGTARRLLAADAHGHRFVGPDNGILSLALRKRHIPTCDDSGAADVPPIHVVALDREQFWRPWVSRTFHGRDIMAPVAAHLANGVPLDELGSRVESFHEINEPPLRTCGDRMTGQIVAVDRFGNLITNISQDNLQRFVQQPGCHDVRVDCAAWGCLPIVRTYADAPVDHVVCIVGSQQFLEIAVRNGNASRILGWSIGDPVHVSAADRRQGDP